MIVIYPKEHSHFSIINTRMSPAYLSCEMEIIIDMV